MCSTECCLQRGAGFVGAELLVHHTVRSVLPLAVAITPFCFVYQFRDPFVPPPWSLYSTSNLLRPLHVYTQPVQPLDRRRVVPDQRVEHCAGNLEMAIDRNTGLSFADPIASPTTAAFICGENYERRAKLAAFIYSHSGFL